MTEVVHEYIYSAAARKNGINTAGVLAVIELPFYREIDNEKAMKLGVSVSTVTEALGAFLGANYVNDFNRFGRQYKVFLQAQGQDRQNPEAVKAVETWRKEQTERALSGRFFASGTPEQIGPVVSNYHIWWRKIQKALDPNGVSTESGALV